MVTAMFLDESWLSKDSILAIATIISEQSLGKVMTADL
jgi:hypothetical protein